jgi:hypothetical protein
MEEEMSEKEKSNTLLQYLMFFISFCLLLAPPAISYCMKKFAVSGCINYSYEPLLIVTLFLSIIFAAISSLFLIHKRWLINILVVSGVIIMPAALALPNFIKHPSRAKHCIAATSLKQLIMYEENFFSKNGDYSTSFNNLNWEQQDRIFCYELSETEISKPSKGYDCPQTPGITPFVSKDRFLIVAVGNIDNDSTPDVWSIDEKGELKNIVDDVKQ